MNKKYKIVYFIFIAVFLFAFHNLTAFAQTNSGMEGFVTRLYQQTLNRSPDVSGFNFWTNQLANGTKSGADVSLHFIFSSEFTKKNIDTTNFINIMYRAFFDREPDNNGLSFWHQKISEGYSRRYVLANFVNSKEFESISARYHITPGSINLTKADKVPKQDGSVGTPVITDAIRNSIVTIKALNSTGEAINNGFGYIIDNDGTTLTTYSLLKEAYGGIVKLSDGREAWIEKVVGHDIYRDIVLVKIPTGDYSTIQLGNSRGFANNQAIFGTRINDNGVVDLVKGTVKSVDRQINNISFLETSSILTYGNNCGLILNSNSELTGILLKNKYIADSNIVVQSEVISQLLSSKIDLPASSLKGIKTISVPSSLQLDISADNKIVLKWDGVTGAASYNVYRSEKQEGPYELLASSKTTEFQSSTLNQNKAYWYSISAVKGVLESDLSSAIVLAVLNQGRTQYEVEPNDAVSQANVYSVGTIRNFSTLSGTLKNSDVDYYQINITKNGYIRVKGNSSLKSGNLLMALNDSKDQILATKVSDGAGNFEIRQYVTAGTYYVVFFPSATSTGVQGTYMFYSYME